MTIEEQAIEQAAKDEYENFLLTDREQSLGKSAFVIGAKSPEAKSFHTKGMYNWDEINMMLSAFICEYCSETSIKFSPGMFINKYFEQNKKKQ